MATIEELKQIVGALMKVAPETLDESTVLNGLLASSIGRARLDATLRSRLGLTIAGVYSVATFGELAHVFGVEGSVHTTVGSANSRPLVATTKYSDAGMAVGIDIQAVSELPEESDYWEGDFYQQHFTKQEIAHALLQPSPRESLTAIWCAKEALRKADEHWAGVDWQLTEITHDAAGRPILRSGEEIIHCAVSLSHTDCFAVAVVVMGINSALTPQAIPSNPPPALLPPPQRSVSGSWLSLALSVAALLVSLLAAAYSILK